jgi:hypothetical protein
MAGALGIIRSFTEEDQQALNDSALRFAKRHATTLGTDDQPSAELDMYLWSRPDTWSDTRSLCRLWQACRCRALGVPVAADVAVAYGSIGYRVR